MAAMLQNLPLFPARASTYAGQVDAIFFFLVAVSAFFITLIFLLVAYLGIKYRQRSPEERPRPVGESLWLELTWTIIPLGITMVVFTWGARLYFFASRPPATAMEIFAVGKQWMWKFQHPEGQREIDELHVPAGHPIKLTMASEDVIHSFFVPAFRVKQDVVPGRYLTVWFQATRPGEYHLFCTQYCGTLHAGMVGRVVVMSPVDYERWLRGALPVITPAAAGEMLFERLGCDTCHRPDGTGRGPSLVELFGKLVRLADGRRAVADEAYIRESILDPNAKLVAGYKRIMPTFKGLVSEEGILQIVAYVKSLKREERPPQARR